MGSTLKLAPRMSAVKESPTAATSAKAAALIADGRDIINLGEGELDFDTPEHICEAGILAIRNGETRYTPVAGTDRLKQAIRRKFKTDNGLEYQANQIIAATGAKQLIFNAMLATVSEGGEVLIPIPSWVSYPDIVSLCGGSAVHINCDEASGFKLTPEALAEAITEKTKWLILNSPNNPTGTVYDAAELKAIAAVLINHPHVMVLADDIYEHIIYDGQFTTIAEAEPALYERVLTVNGVSKILSMTGWRLGYAGGPSWLIRAMEILQSQSTTNASSISQAAAAAGLEASLDFFHPRLEALRNRRDVVLATLKRTAGCLSAGIPQGAFYVFANCSGMIGSTTPNGGKLVTDVDVASYLLEQAGIALVPGSAFGASPYIRIAFAIDDTRLAEACERLVSACAKL